MLIYAVFVPFLFLIGSVFPLDGADQLASLEAGGTGGQHVNIIF